MLLSLSEAPVARDGFPGLSLSNELPSDSAAKLKLHGVDRMVKM